MALPFESEQLVGVAEAARMLHLSRPALVKRSKANDFPQPLARLAAGPVWARESIVAYAKARAQAYEERPGVEALAAEGEFLSVEDAAATIGTTPGQLRAVAAGFTLPGGKYRFRDGELIGVHRSDLGLIARILGAQPVETAVMP
jgi:predicted DNA-binding transcriptional regulator AlpA